MASDTEHLSYVSGPSSLEKCVFKSFARFLIGLFVFLEWSRVSYYYILEIKTLVRGIIGKYVFPYSCFSFHFNAVFFSHAEAF